MEETMNEMTKYGRWYEEESRTVRSRGIIFTREEMDLNDYLYANGEVMNSLVRRGVRGPRPGVHNAKDILDICEGTRAVLVDTSVKKVGENLIRVYSGMVFVNEWAMHIFVMRRKFDYPDVLLLPRLSN